MAGEGNDTTPASLKVTLVDYNSNRETQRVRLPSLGRGADKVISVPNNELLVDSHAQLTWERQVRRKKN